MCDGSGGKDGEDEGVVASAESCFSVAWRFYLKWGGRGYRGETGGQTWSGPQPGETGAG